MATPSNINLLTRQILTTDGRVEQLPIGALRLPPPVRFRQAECIAAGAGGLCIWEGICYVGAICTGAWVPILCVTIALGAGALVIQLCNSTPAEQYENAFNQIEIWYAAQQAVCNAMGDEEAKQRCLRNLKDTLWLMIQELQEKFPNGGRTTGNGINGSNIFEA